MFVKINGNDVEVKFNIGFIRRLDEMHKVDSFGTNLNMGVGLNIAMMQLSQRDAAGLSDVIFAAIKAQRITREQVDEAVEKYAEEGKYDELLNKVVDELGESAVVAGTLNMPVKEAIQTEEKKESKAEKH